MKQFTFDTYDKYLYAQRRTTLNRHGNPVTKFSSELGVIQAIVKYHPTPIKFGLCHGVRHEDEIDLFEQETGGEWIGSEIVEELCDGKRIIHADFSDVLNGWKGKFDIVYSNALDHARDPEVAVKAWLTELNITGRLYIEWNKCHNKLGVGINKADCFAASYEEYKEMLEKLGDIEAILKPKNMRLVRRIFVVCLGIGEGYYASMAEKENKKMA